MKLKTATLCLVSCLAMIGVATDGTAADSRFAKLPESAVPVTLDHAARWDMQAQHGDRSYRIFLSVPAQPAPPDGYPVLYVLDGNSLFRPMVWVVRRLEEHTERTDWTSDDLPPTLIVGIGYPPATDISSARQRDLTPPTKADTPRLSGASGGADSFLKFIQQDLKPTVADIVKVNPDRQTLFGHSFGGLFTLYALTTQPQSFHTYLAASPSLWYAGETMMDTLKSFAVDYKQPEGSRQDVRVLVTVGEFEGTPSPWAATSERDGKMSLAALDQVGNARDATRILDKSLDIAARYSMIIGEDHGSSVAGSITKGARFMARGFTMATAPVPAVPGPQEYLEMTPEQRYRLRMQVRALPDEKRYKWIDKLKKSVYSLPQEPHLELHEERNRMDRLHGTMSRAIDGTAEAQAARTALDKREGTAPASAVSAEAGHKSGS